MSLSIRFTGGDDGETSFQLASARGAALLRQWLMPLSPLWLQFFERGGLTGTMDMAVDLTAALNTSPPVSADVLDTAEKLLDNIGHGDDNETAMLIGEEDEPDDGEPIGLSIDAIPTLHINRPLNPSSSPTPPDIPSADEIADETIGYLESVLAEIQDRLLAGQPFGDEAAKLDRLVAQAELSSWIAGAVGVWHDSREPRTYMLDLGGGQPTKRFPWIEEAARWLMDRNIYSAQEIQAQARGEFEPRWKSLEAATTLRDEIASGFTTGESFEQFYARIKSKVDATKPELQNAFRTSTHQAYIHGTTNTLEKPLVKLQFPYVVYRSAHDTRTRVTHRPLDGLLFAVGGPAYQIARRALNDFNCRCGIRSMTDADAKKEKLRPVEVADLPAEVLAKYGN